MEKTFKLTRTYLSWRRPGGEELGRVELVGDTRLDSPEPFMGRTYEEITIPRGCVLSYVVEDDDPLLP